MTGIQIVIAMIDRKIGFNST